MSCILRSLSQSRRPNHSTGIRDGLGRVGFFSLDSRKELSEVSIRIRAYANILLLISIDRKMGLRMVSKGG